VNPQGKKKVKAPTIGENLGSEIFWIFEANDFGKWTHNFVILGSIQTICSHKYTNKIQTKKVMNHVAVSENLKNWPIIPKSHQKIKNQTSLPYWNNHWTFKCALNFDQVCIALENPAISHQVTAKHVESEAIIQITTAPN
jgi:hypothetical protein